jgi:hypothetical protein
MMETALVTMNFLNIFPTYKWKLSQPEPGLPGGPCIYFLRQYSISVRMNSVMSVYVTRVRSREVIISSLPVRLASQRAFQQVWPRLKPLLHTFAQSTMRLYVPYLTWNRPS